MSKYIDELRDVIRRLHGAEAMHVESVAVKEMFKGQTVWEGIVEVFDLVGHPTAHRIYAWANDTDETQTTAACHSSAFASGEISTGRS